MEVTLAGLELNSVSSASFGARGLGGRFILRGGTYLSSLAKAQLPMHMGGANPDIPTDLDERTINFMDMANAMSSRGFKGGVDLSRDPAPRDINEDLYDVEHFSRPLADRSSGLRVGMTPSMLARNGNTDEPAPRARHGGGGGTSLDAPAPRARNGGGSGDLVDVPPSLARNGIGGVPPSSEPARKGDSGTSDPARKSVSGAGAGSVSANATAAGAAVASGRVLRSMERYVAQSKRAALAARGALRERPGDAEEDDLQAYLGEEAAVVALEGELCDAEADLAAALADVAHKPTPSAVAAAVLDTPEAEGQGGESGSEEGGGGGWQDGIRTPMQPSRTLRSRATDDVAVDGGGVLSPSLRDAMVAARRRRQGATAYAAPFVTDPYTEQRHLVSHAEGVVVLSQARQQLAQAAQRYPAISAALLEQCGGRDTPRPPLSDFPAAVVCEASREVQLQEAVLRVLAASCR